MSLDKINKSVENAVKEEKATSGARTKKALGEAAGKFPAYGDPTPANQKLGSISLLGHSEQLLKKEDVRDTKIALPLQFVPYLDLRYTLDEIKETLKSKFDIVTDVYSYGGYIVAELNKEFILKEPELKLISDLGKNAIENHINFEAIPAGLITLTEDRKLKYFDDKFGIILDLKLVLANLILPSVIYIDNVVYNDEEKAAIIKDIISKCRVASEAGKESADFMIEFVKVPEEKIYFISKYRNFIWSSLSMSLEHFKVLANGAIKAIDSKSTVVFRPLANILKNADKNSAKSKALIKSKTVAYDEVPVIKLSSQYMTGATGSNKTLYTGQYLVDRIADRKIINLTFSELVNEDVIIMSDEVSGTVYLIPDLFKMLQYTVLRKVSENTNGEYVFNPFITAAIRVNLVVEDGEIRIVFTA